MVTSGLVVEKDQPITGGMVYPHISPVTTPFFATFMHLEPSFIYLKITISQRFPLYGQIDRLKGPGGHGHIIALGACLDMDVLPFKHHLQAVKRQVIDIFTDKQVYQYRLVKQPAFYRT